MINGWTTTGIENDRTEDDIMRLKMALDALHRKIEEWTEEAMIEPEVEDAELEGFREFGTELVGYLHDAAEKLEIDDRELVIPPDDIDADELCEELTDIFVDEWAMIDFAERPIGVEIDGLREVMEMVAEALQAPPDDCVDELEDAIMELDDFLAEVL